MNDQKTNRKLDNAFKESQGSNFCVIEGSTMEGGGQILRNCISLSSLLSKPIKIVHIRANRKPPGMKAQHLNGILLINSMYTGKLIGGKLKSSEIEYTPGDFHEKESCFVADTQTAGYLIRSVALLMQVSLPCLAFAPRKITLQLKGGTVCDLKKITDLQNAEAAPQIDYMTQVFVPIVSRFGCQFDIDIVKRGYYPKGGGQVDITSTPIKSLHPITMIDRGRIVKIHGRSFVAGVLKRSIAERMSLTIEHKIREFFKNEPEPPQFEFEVVQETEKTSFGNGCGTIVLAHTTTGCILAGSSLGKKGKPSEEVGEEAVNELLTAILHGGCTDEYLQDQLILFMALASGVSKISTGPLSLHTKTSIFFTQKLTGAKFKIYPATALENNNNSSKETAEFDVNNIDNTPNEKLIIECEGIGFQNKYL